MADSSKSSRRKSKGKNRTSMSGPTSPPKVSGMDVVDCALPSVAHEVRAPTAASCPFLNKDKEFLDERLCDVQKLKLTEKSAEMKNVTPAKSPQGKTANAQANVKLKSPATGNDLVTSPKSTTQISNTEATPSSTTQQNPPQKKSKADFKAERALRIAKALNKKQEDQSNPNDTLTKSDNKQEKASNQQIDIKVDAKVKDINITTNDSGSGKSKAELKAERRLIHEAQRAAVELRSEEKTKGIGENEKQTPGAKENIHGTKLPVSGEVTKSKADLKAERRAIQEAQRAAKAQKNEEKTESAAKNVTNDKKPAPGATKSVAAKPTVRTKEVQIVNHLPQYKTEISVVKARQNGVHPAIIQLGLQYAEGIISGSNSRCVSFIQALIKAINDFNIPENKESGLAIYSMCIEPSMKFLDNCRPTSVGMKNVCKTLQDEIATMPKDIPGDEVKAWLVDILENFLENHVYKAHDSIVNLSIDKITSTDVILTYGCSYIIKRILKAAHEKCKFRVIVVDGRPKLEGRNMLHFLVENGIECTYVLINALGYVMEEASKVFIGAHALLTNGCVMSRAGTSQVALVAKAFNKPVIVCCETYKFCDMVQTDSILNNELGNPEEIVKFKNGNNPLDQWRSIDNLNILSLSYDITYPDLVSMLINERYIVPCTSVPVVLRLKPKKKEDSKFKI